MKVLILDNYDSFTWNLVQMVGTCGADPRVFRNDGIDLDAARDLKPDRIIISPGPGRPDQPGWFGGCTEIIRSLAPTIPLLGVCLGHQGLAWVCGARIRHAPRVMHGKTSRIRIDQRGVFRGLPEQIEVMRYHSLIVDRETLPAEMIISAETADGVVMGLRHAIWPAEGVQFHPESIGTASGEAMIRNFLEGR